MDGLKMDELTDEQKKEYTVAECDQPIWPPFMPQCISCLAEHKCQRYLKDKKGRKSKVIG